MAFNVDLLPYFVAVADNLSFHKAAVVLCTRKTKVARAIQVLERQLGLALFERDGRRIFLTDKGLRLRRAAKAVAEHTAATYSYARELALDYPNRLRVGVPYYALYAKERLELFDSFFSNYPDARFEIVIRNAASLREQLLSGALDLLFVASGKKAVPQMDYAVLCEGRLDVIMADTDTLCEKERVLISDLRTREIAGLPGENVGELHELFFGSLQKRGFKVNSFGDYSYYTRFVERQMLTILPSWAPLPDLQMRRRPLNTNDIVRFNLVRSSQTSSVLLESLWQATTQKFSDAA